VWANGHEEAELTVLVTNEVGEGIPGTIIRVDAEPPEDVIIEPSTRAETDDLGKAHFHIRSAQVGPVTFTINDVDNPVLTDQVELSFIERKVVVFVQGVNTQLFHTTDATTFPEVRKHLKGFSRPTKGDTAETGIECANATDDDGDSVPNDGCPLVINYSYNGGEVDIDTGIWTANDYICGNTAQSLFASSIPFLKKLVADFSNENPNTRFVIIGHSQGGFIALRSLELVPERPDLVIHSIITLDGVLGGAPDVNAFALAGITCWDSPAAVEIVGVWNSVRKKSDHKKQGTKALDNEALVDFAQINGTKVLTVGSKDDCVFNLRRCGLPGPKNTSSQIVRPADRLLKKLGGNCGLGKLRLFGARCIELSHNAVLEHPDVLDRIEEFVGSPTVP